MKKKKHPLITQYLLNISRNVMLVERYIFYLQFANIFQDLMREKVFQFCNVKRFRFFYCYSFTSSGFCMRRNLLDILSHQTCRFSLNLN